MRVLNYSVRTQPRAAADAIRNLRIVNRLNRVEMLRETIGNSSPGIGCSHRPFFSIPIRL
jgi:hypothetical protein